MTNVTIMVLVAVTAYVVCRLPSPGVSPDVPATYLVTRSSWPPPGRRRRACCSSPRKLRRATPHTPGWAGHRNLPVPISTLKTAGVGPLVSTHVALVPVRHETQLVRPAVGHRSCCAVPHHLRHGQHPVRRRLTALRAHRRDASLFPPPPVPTLVAVTTPTSISRPVLILPDLAGVFLTDLDSPTAPWRPRPGRTACARCCTKLVCWGYRFTWGTPSALCSEPRRTARDAVSPRRAGGRETASCPAHAPGATLPHPRAPRHVHRRQPGPWYPDHMVTTGSSVRESGAARWHDTHTPTPLSREIPAIDEITMSHSAGGPRAPGPPPSPPGVMFLPDRVPSELVERIWECLRSPEAS